MCMKEKRMVRHMEKYNIYTHPKDRFKVHDLLDKSKRGYGRCGWDCFFVNNEQLELLRENNIHIEIKLDDKP